MAIRIKDLTRIRNREMVYRTLGDAFENYPKLSKAFPDKERRRIAIEATIRFYGAYDMRYGAAYSLDSNCNEVVVIVHSRNMNYSKFKHFIAGSYSKSYKEVISKLTEEERQRRDELFDEMDDMEKEISFPYPHLYIDFLGVKTKLQQQGRGKKLMKHVLTYADRKKLPVMLFTNTPEDIAFYRSLGFKVVGITSSKKFQFINTYLVRD